MLARTELSEFFTRAFARFDVEILQDEFEMVSSYIFYGLQEPARPLHAALSRRSRPSIDAA